jgi:hypothetical protein
LQIAADWRELQTSADQAAVLDLRLLAPAPPDPGPLPWLPGAPRVIRDHPIWGGYLDDRSKLIADLADQVRGQAGEGDAAELRVPPSSQPT